MGPSGRTGGMGHASRQDQGRSGGHVTEHGRGHQDGLLGRRLHGGLAPRHQPKRQRRRRPLGRVPHAVAERPGQALHERGIGAAELP